MPALELFRLGDRIWLDANGNGIQDDGEVGINGATVTATPDGDEGRVVSTETTGDGDYRFDDLEGGTYRIVVTGIPGGLVNSADPDTGLSNPDGIATIVLDTDRTDQDFGYRPTTSDSSSSIGDTIYLDANGNGQQDDGEGGIPGIGVTLGGDADRTATTGPDGTYLFEGLDAGDYTVTVDPASLPSGVENTADEDGNNDGITSVVLGDDDHHLTADFGYGETVVGGDATIGDVIYLDLDGDGTQGDGESGVSGQRVDLGLPGGATLTTTTGPDGSYRFSGLADGIYTVTVVGGVADDASNSGDPDGGNDNTSTTTISGGVDDLERDFGYLGDNTIGDTVFNDVDRDGVDDGAADEPRLEGVSVVVIWFGQDANRGGGDDVVIGTFVTDVNGNYLATNLPDGRFSVAVTGGVPAGFDVTVDPQGTVDPDGASTVTVTGGSSNIDQDFGYATPIDALGSIGDDVWLDLDGDGVQDDGEPGIAGVTVTLTELGPDGTTRSTTTDEAGHYLFENLPAGEFIVTVSNLPAGLTPTADPDGGDDLVSSVTLAPGQSNLDQDFGFNRNTAAVGDTIFIDANGNGIQDGLEPGVAGITVTVTSAGPDGVLTTVTVTDVNGKYFVDGLLAGPTTVSYPASELPNGFSPTSDLDGGIGDGATTATIVLAPGETNRDVDFAVGGSGAIDGTVFEDTDNDGVQDPGEPGIAGVVVIVTQEGPDGVVTIPTVTGPDGGYVVDNLPPGDYTVTVDPSTLPPGVTVDPAPTTVTVPRGETVTVDIPATGSTVLPAAPATTAPTTTAPGNALIPTTGSETRGLLIVASILLLAGIALSATRRKPDAAAAPNWPAPGA